MLSLLTLWFRYRSTLVYWFRRFGKKKSLPPRWYVPVWSGRKKRKRQFCVPTRTVLSKAWGKMNNFPNFKHRPSVLWRLSNNWIAQNLCTEHATIHFLFALLVKIWVLFYYHKYPRLFVIFLETFRFIGTLELSIGEYTLDVIRYDTRIIIMYLRMRNLVVELRNE